jgi:hypothetical protein
MIKIKDKTPTPNRNASCLAESDTAPGIAFEKSDGTKRFAPNSFLSSVDFDGEGELIFRYAFGTIIVRGQGLESLWNALCRGTLAKVIEQAKDPSAASGASVHSVVVKDDENSSGPRFPEKSQLG